MSGALRVAAALWFAVVTCRPVGWVVRSAVGHLHGWTFPLSHDLSDARRQLIEPVLIAWRARRQASALGFGRPAEHDLRSIMNAIVYVDRTGIAWRYPPHDHPPWQTVYRYLAA